MKLLLVGSTGLVGRDVLDKAFADPRVTEVVAPSRRAHSPHPKLHAPLVDFDRLPAEAPWWKVDAVVCALGTTMKVAGSQATFRRVDYEYPLAVARLAKAHGVPTYVLNSSLGANPNARSFYLRVKGEIERDLATIGFASLTFVRPGLLGGERQEFRLGERLMLKVLTVVEPLIPKAYRINPAPRVARALLEAALAATSGVHVIPSTELARVR